jgi:hypothetical protein
MIPGLVLPEANIFDAPDPSVPGETISRSRSDGGDLMLTPPILAIEPREAPASGDSGAHYHLRVVTMAFAASRVHSHEHMHICGDGGTCTLSTAVDNDDRARVHLPAGPFRSNISKSRSMSGVDQPGGVLSEIKVPLTTYPLDTLVYLNNEMNSHHHQRTLTMIFGGATQHRHTHIHTCVGTCILTRENIGNRQID